MPGNLPGTDGCALELIPAGKEIAPVEIPENIDVAAGRNRVVIVEEIVHVYLDAPTLGLIPHERSEFIGIVDEPSVITDYQVTDASVHDSQPLPDLIGPQSKDENLFADSAYKSAKTDEKLAAWQIANWIHEKAARSRPLSEAQKALNQLKSKIRCCIEHIFGVVENSMNGPELEYIGRARIETGIGLSNLTYNLQRYVQLIRLNRVAVTQAN